MAIELPTGTGKTLPGLVIVDWVRRRSRRRVAYACPTQQLARQVAEAAERQGIPVAVLVGRSSRRPVDDQTDYEAAKFVAVTT